jgi:hypothetical protein
LRPVTRVTFVVELPFTLARGLTRRVRRPEWRTRRSAAVEQRRLLAWKASGRIERWPLSPAASAGTVRCWDLLRRRRAIRGAGGDPDSAEVHDAGTVEGYLQ